MDWHDRGGEIYLHAILTVLINSGLGSAALWVLSETGFFFILKPTWNLPTKTGQCRQASQATFRLMFAVILE